MALYTRLVINAGNLTAAQWSSQCNLAPGQLPAANNFLNYIAGICGGNYMASMAFKVGAVQATGAITQTGTGALADETVTVCNVVFTAKSSGATGNQWNRSDTVATSATNLAAAINASSDLAGIVTASADGGVVTLTSVVPGLIGNGLELSENATNTSVTAFANGTDGTAYTLDLD